MSVYGLTGTSVIDGTAVVHYANVQSVRLMGASGWCQYLVQALPAGPSVSIHAQGNGNLLRGPNSNTVWAITTADGGGAGKVQFGSLHFSGIQNITGGSGVNAFVFSDGASISGKIDGGSGGNNWLDYAAYTTPVLVNLANGMATGVGLGIADIRNARGGQGGNYLIGNSQGNILIGGAGPNRISGGTNPSLLIGGKGPDTVFGGSGDDILIAGYTDYDASTLANDLALEAILAEWQSANLYSTRIARIKSGVGPNGTDKLVWGVTVHDNAVTNANTLIGWEPGENWFFANPTHTTINKTPFEELN
jgi:Ca2+-binding RTX toxin-like protein